VAGDAADGEIRHWLERFRIPEYHDRKVEELSKGNQQKIQFIAAILHDPDVLIMDEPFSGLDPINVRLLKEAFLAMRERGKTLIFSTHQMDRSKSYASRSPSSTAVESSSPDRCATFGVQWAARSFALRPMMAPMPPGSSAWTG
jgi:ABC-type lipoprotein export system ATPase subunit